MCSSDLDIDAEVLHRQVEHFLGGARKAVNLINEEDVALLKAGQDRGEVAGMLDRGSRGKPQGRAHFLGDDHGESRLAESRRACEQHMIRGDSSAPGSVEDELQLIAHDVLADELREVLGPQSRFGGTLEFARVGRHDAGLVCV